IKQDLDAREVIIACQEGFFSPRCRLGGDLIEMFRVFWMPAQVCEEALTVQVIKGWLAGLHAVEQLAPRCPEVGAAVYQRRLPKGVGTVALEIGAEQRHRKLPRGLLRKHPH